jgi:hypothetical protein
MLKAFFVFSMRFELISTASEAIILSIELREQYLRKYRIFLVMAVAKKFVLPFYPVHQGGYFCGCR